MADSIDRLNEEIKQRGYDWVAGETPINLVGDDSDVAFLGVQVDETALSADMALAESVIEWDGAFAAAPPPPEVDFTSHSPGHQNFVTSVKFQKTCGSCVAFATCASVESRYAYVKGNNDPAYDLSEAHLYFCGGRKCAGPNGGWWPSLALQFAQRNGFGKESDFPYSPTDQPCKKIPTAMLISGHRAVSSIVDRKADIADNGPSIAVMRVYDDFSRYKGGTYKATSSVFRGLHAISVVGYSDVKRAWKIKNSWSSGWGDHGFAWIGYGECGI